mmetsp:Transcript_4647/g.10253  ORF Transcript_4647/g.10253 Transcript_4647/m.10253 type:complete len:215 (-) Transcript_4647:1553-2197(-)
MDASALGSCMAAVLDANVSGNDVPNATKVIAVISSGRSRTQPSMDAMSPTMAVTPPVINKLKKKVSQPPQYFVGGTNAKTSFQGTLTTCNAQSATEASFCASADPLQYKASIICSNTLPAARRCNSTGAAKTCVNNCNFDSDCVLAIRSMMTSQVSLSACSSWLMKVAPPYGSTNSAWKTARPRLVASLSEFRRTTTSFDVSLCSNSTLSPSSA